MIVVGHMTSKEAQALTRLLSVAKSDTGQSRLVANFLLSWWNATACGGFALNDLWGLDTVLRNDVQIVMGFIARKQVYPDTLGLADDFQELIKTWRPQLSPPSVWEDFSPTDGRIYPARLVTYGNSPGYRDISLQLAINDEEGKPRHLEISLVPQDAIDLMHGILQANRTAWGSGSPIDATEGERQPAWLWRGSGA